MVLATVGYHKLLNFYKQQSYQSLPGGYEVNLVLLYVFDFCYFAGLANVFLRTLLPVDIFIYLVFALGAIYIFFSAKSQSNAAMMLREKTLETMQTFVNTIDQKEFYSKNHSKHVYDIVNLYYDYLDEYHVLLNKVKLLDAAMLHDIGKINISAELLHKAGKLNSEEWEIIKSHPRKGKEMLDKTSFSEISDWVLYHHERVDGNGYYNATADIIPLEAKIITIADSYSALCNDRPFRPRMRHEEAMEIIRGAAGKQFDRKLAECFLKIDREALERL
jgi:HD-GYP domain-containing protein (c-di-GMP phosphodiesterase class II)